MARHWIDRNADDQERVAPDRDRAEGRRSVTTFDRVREARIDLKDGSLHPATAWSQCAPAFSLAFYAEIAVGMKRWTVQEGDKPSVVGTGLPALPLRTA